MLITKLPVLQNDFYKILLQILLYYNYVIEKTRARSMTTNVLIIIIVLYKIVQCDLGK